MILSAAAMSAKIRAKKKKMMEDQEAVKLSGIPEDATDEMIIRNKEYGEMLSENKPKEFEEDPTIEAEMAQERKAQPHEEMAPDPKEDDEMKKAKNAKIRSMMMRMR